MVNETLIKVSIRQFFYFLGTRARNASSRAAQIARNLFMKLLLKAISHYDIFRWVNEGYRMSEFIDKVVYVSGAAGNLGQAVTKIFLSKGAYVVALDILDQDLQTVFPNFADRVSSYVIDLTDLDACNALFCRLAEEKKTADILRALTGGFQWVIQFIKPLSIH
jgi:hypothetical protein